MKDPRKKKTKYKQGNFKPEHPKKYVGSYPITFRSSWEYRFMRWADNNPMVVDWISETVTVPYYNPIKRRQARYYPDFVLTVRTKEGKLKKWLVEVKPKKETMPPERKRGKRKATLLYEQATWAVNTAKWEAAKKWAEKHYMKFVLVTEEHIFGRKR